MTCWISSFDAGSMFWICERAFESLRESIVYKCQNRMGEERLSNRLRKVAVLFRIADLVGAILSLAFT